MTLTCTNVTLRQKPLRNDRISLYLDYYPAIRNPYTMKMSRREFLGIYIYAKPKNEQQRMFNQDMLNKAEAIRCIRVQSLINEEFGFLDKNKQKVDFLAYFRTKAREKYEKWDCVYNHFEKFVGGKCTFGDVTVELCEKFKDYLLKCKQINHPNAYISRNSAAGYYSTFRALLKIAYKEKMLRENLNDFLEKIEWKEVKKEYLTLDEVNKPKFDRLLDKALETYARKRERAKKRSAAARELKQYNWEVPEERVYDSETNHIETAKNHALLPFIQLNEVSNPEKEFVKYLEEHSQWIDWWYKNGDKGKQHYAIAYGKSLFYVDFVIRMKNGHVYLFDTKSAGSDVTAPEKHNALLQYIQEYSTKDTPLYGGVIIQDGSNWLYSKLPIENTTDLLNWDAFYPKNA